ncbi:MAG: hypothetical protein KAR32_03185, partial [Candidatus Omnitrophica bacterium]|nr:hypothetical protein [Candidatus Omnitrophota bacterium]
MPDNKIFKERVGTASAILNKLQREQSKKKHSQPEQQVFFCIDEGAAEIFGLDGKQSLSLQGNSFADLLQDIERKLWQQERVGFALRFLQAVMDGCLKLNEGNEEWPINKILSCWNEPLLEGSLFSVTQERKGITGKQGSNNTAIILKKTPQGHSSPDCVETIPEEIEGFETRRLGRVELLRKGIFEFENHEWKSGRSFKYPQRLNEFL